MFEFFGSIGGFALVIAFVVFLVAVRTILKTILRLLFVVAAAIAFPFVANAFGLGVPTDLNTILSFIVIGIISTVILGIFGWLRKK
jgi:uncharacterized membrane-anchored protein